MALTLSYFIASFFSLFSNAFNKGRFVSNFFLVASFFVLFFPLALRNELVGIDTAAYYKIFEYLKDIDGFFNLEFEIGYQLLNNIVYYFGGDAVSVLFIAAFLSLAPFFYFAYKYSVNYLASLAILCGVGIYGFMYNGVRQAIAMGIVLIAFHMIIRRKLWISVLLIIFSSMFHYTSLIFFVAYLFILLRFSFFWALLVWVFSLFFLMPFLSNYIFQYFIFLVPDNYIWYVEAGLVESSLRVRFLADQLICIFLLYFIYARKKYDIDEIGLSLLYITFFGFVLNNITAQMGYIERLSLYFTMFSYVSIPYLARFVLDKKSFYLFLFFIYMFFTFFYFRGLFSGANGMIPYFTIWK